LRIISILPSSITSGPFDAQQFNEVVTHSLKLVFNFGNMHVAWVACLTFACMWSFERLCALEFRKFVRATHSGMTINNVIVAGLSTQCASECDTGGNCVMFGFSKEGRFCYLSNSDSETEEMQPVPTGMKIYQDSSYTTVWKLCFNQLGLL